jgi:hypothetical protein
MENIQKTHEERQQRIAELTVEQNGFIERFLHTHRYFYVPTTEQFVSYNGKHYELVLEDNILHHILTTITEEKLLMIWKQQTKVYLMKRIKSNSLMKSVPESETIQTVIDQLSPFFESRQEVKYFLTILGDNMFRKQSELVHFIHPRAKAFLREISNLSHCLFGVNAAQTFKHKFHDHDYENCRLLNCGDSIANESEWAPVFCRIAIDLMCVACHYSVRYGSSDEYISKYCHQYNLEQSVFFLKNHTRDQLVQRFLDEYIDISAAPMHSQTNTPIPYSSASLFGTTPPSGNTGLLSSQIYGTSPSSNSNSILSGAPPSGLGTLNTLQISWKNMQYLWRNFLQRKRIFTVMFHQDLKSILIQKLTPHYREEQDGFVGISSRYMPAIRAFLDFWEKNVIPDENGEYELDEMCMLYKKWVTSQHRSGTLNVSMNEKYMIDLIGYYFPHIEMDGEKYIYRIRVAGWDKQMDVQTALDQLRDSLWTDSHSDGSERIETRLYAISIYDAYVWYCKYYSENRGHDDAAHMHHPIVSKKYFEKYIAENMGSFVVENAYLSNEWLRQSIDR